MNTVSCDEEKHPSARFSTNDGAPGPAPVGDVMPHVQSGFSLVVLKSTGYEVDNGHEDSSDFATECFYVPE